MGSFFSIITYGLSVALVGIGTVFVGLVILIGMIYAVQKILARIEEMKGKGSFSLKGVLAKSSSSSVSSSSSASSSSSDGQPNDNELIAVITAAVAAMLSAEQGVENVVEEAPRGFVVRSIRRVSNAPVWNRAGREEQIYSRM